MTFVLLGLRKNAIATGIVAGIASRHANRQGFLALLCVAFLSPGCGWDASGLAGDGTFDVALDSSAPSDSTPDTFAPSDVAAADDRRPDAEVDTREVGLDALADTTADLSLEVAETSDAADVSLPDAIDDAADVLFDGPLVDGDTLDVSLLDTGTIDSASDSGALDTSVAEVLDTRPPPLVGSCAVAGDTLTLDRVKGADGPIGTDGAKDGAFLATVEGRVNAVILISVDATGKPAGGQQWDTYVGSKAIPFAVGTSYRVGSSTWQLGVWEEATARNAPDGSFIPTGDGTHILHLYASNASGAFVKGRTFAVLAEREDGSIFKGPTITY